MPWAATTRPTWCVDGLELAAERHPGARFLLIGDEAGADRRCWRGTSRAQAACTVRHAPDVIGNDMKPTAALRMRGSPRCALAIDAVAAARPPAWSRPATPARCWRWRRSSSRRCRASTGRPWPAIGPSARGDVVMLDLGANVQCDARNLVEFAVMGDVFARTVLGLTAPTIGLLNVGSEELKGDDTRARGRRNPAREPYRPAIPRLRRGPRHRRRHHRRGRHRRLHRQRRAEDRRGRAEADRRPAAAGVHQQPRRPRSPICWPGPGWTGCANGSIRGATTARSCSG